MISKALAILSLLIFTTFAFVSPNDDKEIESVLITQSKCWNDGDIDGFMQTYWKSEDLTFSGGGKMTRGWDQTLARYKKSYPKGEMGKLTFDELEVTMLSEEAALVLGNWHLSIPQKDAEEDSKVGGNFSLVLRKLEGSWKIIHDHSSTLEEEIDKEEKPEH